MTEPNALIRWTIFVFAGGGAGIFGAFSIAVTAMLIFFPGRKRAIRPFYIAAVLAIGMMFIACGSLPMPIGLQFATMIYAIYAISPLRFRTARITPPAIAPDADLPESRPGISSSRWSLFLAPFAWLLTLMAIELPFHLWFVPAEQVSRVMVIGDSVTAGLNDGEDTWPRQLSRAAKVEILDASQPGATIESARKQNSMFSGQTGLVFIEIGGNDMLEGLPVAKFEKDFDKLLTDVVQPVRTVVMFELPLPPLCAAYGTAQRRQAAKHRVRMIPKRLFATVLTTSGATVDGIHLSIKGQTLMTALVQSLFGERLGSGMGQYRHFDRR